MSTLTDNGQADKARAEELISTIPLIPEVDHIDVELYTDNTGDPSFQIVFYLHPWVEVTLMGEFLGRFIEFSGKVQTKILHSDLNRFPYTRLEQLA